MNLPDTGATGMPVAPVCYRHSDRETYVRCTRCDRPICPDCMTAASVGFQCPDCVREGNRTLRSGQTVFGGDISGTKGTVTKFLIGSNVAVWLLTVFLAVAAGQVSGSQIGSLLTSGGETAFTQDFAAVPYFLTNGGLAFGGIASGEFYRLLTSDFLHYGIVHIGFNMYALWILGRECERLLGRWRFLLLYLLTGVGGATAVYLFGSPNALVAGASSSIFGLIGAMVFFFKKLQADMRGLIGLIVLNVAITLFVPGISILGHAGGFVLGSALGAVLAYAPAGPMRKQLQLAGIAGVALVMVAVVAARTVQLGLLGVSLP